MKENLRAILQRVAPYLGKLLSFLNLILHNLISALPKHESCPTLCSVVVAAEVGFTEVPGPWGGGSAQWVG